MNILQITAACVCIAVVALGVKSTRSDMGLLITIASVVALTVAMMPYIIKVVSSMTEFASFAPSGESYLVPVLKITGVSYVAQLGKELCEDAGEKALAGRVETAGKIAISVIALPIAKEAFVKIMEILG